MLVVAEVGRGGLAGERMAAMTAVGGGFCKVFARAAPTVLAVDVKEEAKKGENKEGANRDRDGNGNFGIPTKASTPLMLRGGRSGKAGGRRGRWHGRTEGEDLGGGDRKVAGRGRLRLAS